jgi:hypothetical protein
MRKIALFSSDAATLYKKDVFRIMGLQDEFVIHFRYGIEHLSMSLDEFKQAKGQSVLIFYTNGNDLAVDINARQITNIPLREAEIVDVIDASDTGLVHVHLKLKGFENCVFQFPVANQQPPNKWVTEIEVTNENPTTWHERVTALKPYFPNQLFYKIEIFNKEHSEKVSPIYSKEQTNSFYTLSDESDYLIDVSFYDTAQIHSPASQKLEISSEDKTSLKINAPQIIDVGARRDNRKYNLYTQSLSSKSSYSYLNFKTVQNNPATILENDIQLAFQIEKNKLRAFWFSLYTVLAAISVGYSKIISDKWDLLGSFDSTLCIHSFFALALGLFSFYKLYQLFNKK